jgi:predicted metal-dependent peptidase
MDSRTKLGEAARLMSNRTPSLLGFYIMLEKRIVQDSSITMKVGYNDGTPYLEVSEWFIDRLEISMLGAVLYMNCLRIALHHCDVRVKQPEQIFKLASDIVVCEYARNIVDANNDENSEILAKVFPSIWTYSDQFADAGFDPETDLTLEKVFDLLYQNQDSGDSNDDNDDDDDRPDKDEDEDGESGESGGKGDEQDNSSGNSSEQSSDNEDKEDNESGDSDQESGGSDQESGDSNDESVDSDQESGDSGSQGIQQGEQSGQENSSNGPSSAFEAMQQMFDQDNARSDMSDWGENEEFSDQVREQAAAAMANGSLSGMSGKVPLLIKEANKVRVDAATVFRMFVNSNFSSSHRQTWSMPNLVLRRFGTIAPGHVRKKDRPMLLFAIDDSGSMLYMNMVVKCVEMVNAFIGKAKLDICYWDCSCSEILNDPRDAYSGTVFGGGGTDPQCVIDKITRERLDYDGIIFLTDCEFTWDRPMICNKICIIRTPQSSGRFPAWCKWKLEMEDVLR